MNKLSVEEEEAQKIIENDKKNFQSKKDGTHSKNPAHESYDDLAALTDHDMSISDQNITIKFDSSPKRGHPIVLPPIMRQSVADSQIEESPQRVESTKH